MVNVWRALVRPRGDARLDLFLRAAAGLALLGIPIILLFPQAVTLVWLAVLSLPANSPLSPILPTAFEPLIMEAAKYEGAVPVTLVATAGYMYMEYVNWRVYMWILSWDRLEGLGSRRTVRWGVDHFARAPFWTVVVFAFTPLPFFVVRALAILHRWPVWRFMLATLLGRMPRVFLYAWFGEMFAIPTWMLVAVILGGTAAVVGGRLLRGEPVLAEVTTAKAATTTTDTA
ncbi:MAG: VTT domain-containing protein [Gemmatimonadota bacterium]|nr:VTT domain-containing protein [Gemmatimonadota bacterium]MDH5198311.1 VTT domain-containing protein [Gemmatimonadota bacterium]